MPKPPVTTINRTTSPAELHRRHLLVGWWSLLIFLSLGIGLETLHGFKLQWYVSVATETRRLMWTLAHTHGTLLSLVHLAFAATLSSQSTKGISQNWSFASLCLTGSLLLMPLGFFLGGTFVYSGDPGLGVLLVPPGAVLLFCGVASIALAVTRARNSE